MSSIAWAIAGSAPTISALRAGDDLATAVVAARFVCRAPPPQRRPRPYVPPREWRGLEPDRLAGGEGTRRSDPREEFGRDPVEIPGRAALGIGTLDAPHVYRQSRRCFRHPASTALNEVHLRAVMTCKLDRLLVGTALAPSTVGSPSLSLTGYPFSCDGNWVRGLLAPPRPATTD